MSCSSRNRCWCGPPCRASLRVGDEVTLRTLVRNGTSEARDVEVTIVVEGVVLDDEGRTHVQRVEASESIVAAWPARVLRSGHGYRDLQRHHHWLRAMRSSAASPCTWM